MVAEWKAPVQGLLAWRAVQIFRVWRFSMESGGCCWSDPTPFPCPIIDRPEPYSIVPVHYCTRTVASVARALTDLPANARPGAGSYGVARV